MMAKPIQALKLHPLIQFLLIWLRYHIVKLHLICMCNTNSHLIRDNKNLWAKLLKGRPWKWYDSYESSLYFTQTYHIHHLNQSHNVTTHIETPLSLTFTLSRQMLPACLTTGNNYLILHGNESLYLFSLLVGDHHSIEQKKCTSKMTSSVWWKNYVVCLTTKNEKSANTSHFWMHFLDHLFGSYYLWLWKIPWHYLRIAHIFGNFHFKLFLLHFFSIHF